MSTNIKYRKTFGSAAFDAINTFLLVLLAIVTLYPYLYVVFASVSDPVAFYKSSKVVLYPRGFSIAAYKVVFQHPMVLPAYRNTIIYVLLGTTVNVIMNLFGAYVLSKRYLPGVRIFMRIIVFTMFFGGGLIPTFLLVLKLGLIDSILALILPGAVSTWNLIIMRTYFLGLDPAVEESAKMDGANDFTILFKIIVPLSLPVVAVITLFYAVGHWNSFFSAMIYLRTRTKFPLQLILREILIQHSKWDLTGVYEDVEAVAESVKYALIVVSTLPILCLYPYLQKYFIKGIMVGSIK
jgi:putative aldouronate transport system permease protein